MSYIIQDWCGNVLLNGQAFDSFEEGWAWILENILDEDNAYDDYFVVEVL